jgi:hypothetical protein
LLHLGQDHGGPSPCRSDVIFGETEVGAVEFPEAAVARGEGVLLFVVGTEGDADLLEVVCALGAAGGLARGLNGGEEEADQDSDDGDDDEQLDEGEGA